VFASVSYVSSGKVTTLLALNSYIAAIPMTQPTNPRLSLSLVTDLHRLFQAHSTGPVTILASKEQFAMLNAECQSQRKYDSNTDAGPTYSLKFGDGDIIVYPSDKTVAFDILFGDVVFEARITGEAEIYRGYRLRHVPKAGESER
jgi:hypothetical protein